MDSRPQDTPPAEPAAPGSDSAQAIAQNLYARTVEIGIKNKILSLLERLYDVSLQVLSLGELAERFAPILLEDLSCDLVVVFLNDEHDQSVRTLTVAQSERFDAIAQRNGLALANINIRLIDSAALATCITSKQPGEVASLSAVWGPLITEDLDQALHEEAHARFLMLYPLTSGGKVSGVLALGINRSGDQLSNLEHVMFNNAADVVAVALEKTLLYEAVQQSNAQLQDLSRFKSQLLSLASHQIKAPLAAIKGYISLVLEGGYGPMPDNLLKPVQAMQRSADGLVELVTSLLDLRKVEEGKMDYSFEHVDLAEMVRDVVEELGMLAREKGLDLTITGAQNPIYVRADKTKLRQVAQNLVDNAIKYTPSGSVNVSVVVQERFVTCTVADSGLGMAPILLPRLFDEFTRDQRVQHTIRGTGLGLYIAKRIIEAHGGGIYADSAGEGLGSRFWFTLPIDQEIPVPTPDA